MHDITVQKKMSSETPSSDNTEVRSVPPVTAQSGETLFDTISFWSLFALALLLPFFVVPSATAPLLYTKIALTGLFSSLALICYIIARLKQQTVRVPRVLLLASMWLIPLAYLLSTLFQSNPSVTLFGERLSTDTFVFIAFAAIVMSLAAIVANTRSRILTLYLGILGSATIVAVLQLILFFAPSFFAVVGLSVPTLSLLGSLNDLAIFFGLVTVLLLTTLNALNTVVPAKVALWVALMFSLVFLSIINLTFLWYIVGAFALSMFVHSLYASLRNDAHEKNMASSLSFAALLVLVTCAVFLAGGDSLRNSVAAAVNVGELDVRPSWKTTIQISGDVLGDNLLFGTGPGTFTEVWSQYRPMEVNQTVFFNADFSNAIGYVPTSIISTGLIGMLAWFVFLGLFVYVGVRTFLVDVASNTDHVGSYLRLSSFLGALYLWLLAILAAPSPVLLVFAFLLSGLFVASLRGTGGQLRELELSFRSSPKVGFAVTLVLTVILLITVTGLFSLGSRYVAEYYFQRAIAAANTTADLEATERLIDRANTLHNADVYYRLKTDVVLLRIQNLLAEGKRPEEVKDQFQALLTSAITNARQATEADPNDYRNWVKLGTVYQNIVPLGIEGGYESAVRAYDAALNRRPEAPQVILARATLERARGNDAVAREWVDRAIAARTNYTEAIFLLAQLQIAAGEVDEATRSVESATLLNPNNAVAFFQLGLLRYSVDDYAGAEDAFARAVVINPVYANAHYFLGLTQYRRGNVEGAVAAFTNVAATNPDNEEVKSIIENLQAGKEPFVSLESSDIISELETLPVQEEQ